MSTDKLASLKRNKTRDNLIAAYEAYERREPCSLDKLLQLVCKFAYIKVKHVEYDLQFEGAETADDWAQEVSIKVWQGLTGTGRKQFEGNGADFYSWVHKIAFNRAADAFNALDKQKKTHVPMFTAIDEEDERGQVDQFTEENPLIHDQEGHNTYAHVDIPDSVQEVDLTICHLLLSGVEEEGKDGVYVKRSRTYAEIGNVLGMTETAVTKRFQHLRDRLKIEGAQKMAAKRKQLEEQLEKQKSDTLKKRYEAFLASRKSKQAGRP